LIHPLLSEPRKPCSREYRLRRAPGRSPLGFAERPVEPAAVYSYEECDPFPLPYDAVRLAADPDEALRAVRRTTCRAARAEENRAGRRPASRCGTALDGIRTNSPKSLYFIEIPSLLR
jgi:hypothetical protein